MGFGVRHATGPLAMLFAYFSPEVTLPVASVIVTFAGVMMACGRQVGSWIARRLRFGRRK